MDVDPAASMACWEIEIELGGRLYRLPALTAADWWPVLAGDGGTMEIFEQLRPVDSREEKGLLEERLLLGQVTGTKLGEKLLAAVEEAAGRSLHVAATLAAAAQSAWPIVGGTLARRGFRWDVMPLGAALDAIYLTVIEGLDKEAREKFQRALDTEPANGGQKSERARQRAVDDFEAVAGPRPTGGARSNGAQSGGARSRTRPRPRPPRPGDQSTGPMPPPAEPARSDPPATNEVPAVVASPAS